MLFIKMLLSLLTGMVLSATTYTVAGSGYGGGNDLSTGSAQVTKVVKQCPGIDNNHLHDNTHYKREVRLFDDNPYQNRTSAQDPRAEVVGGHDIEKRDFEIRDLVKDSVDYKATSTQGYHTASRIQQDERVKDTAHAAEQKFRPYRPEGESLTDPADKDAFDTRETAVIRRELKFDRTTTSKRIPGQSRTLGVLCPPAVGQVCLDFEVGGLGYCTKTAKYRLESPSHRLSDCAGCKCVNKKVAATTPWVGDRVNKEWAVDDLIYVKNRVSESMSAISPKRKSNKLMVRCQPAPSTKNQHCLDHQEGGMGFCTVMGQYKIDSTKLSKRGCSGCKCVRAAAMTVSNNERASTSQENPLNKGVASTEKVTQKQKTAGTRSDDSISKTWQNIHSRNLDILAPHTRSEPQCAAEEARDQTSSIQSQKEDGSKIGKAAQNIQSLVVRNAYPDPDPEAHPMRANSWLPQNFKGQWYPRPPSTLTSKGQSVPRRSTKYEVVCPHQASAKFSTFCLDFRLGSKGYCTIEGEYRIIMDTHGLFDPKECMMQCLCARIQPGGSPQQRLDNLPEPVLKKLLLKGAMLQGEYLQNQHSAKVHHSNQALHPRQPKSEPDAQPVRQKSLVSSGLMRSWHSRPSSKTTSKGGSIPNRSSKYKVECHNGVSLNCWDVARNGKGYCTPRGEYKLRAYLFSGLYNPARCIAACYCTDPSGKGADNMEQLIGMQQDKEDHPKQYLKITKKGGEAIHPEKLMQDLIEALKEVSEEEKDEEAERKNSKIKPALRPRQPRAEPKVGRLRQWFQSKLNIPSHQDVIKYEVDCPSGVSALCQDLNKNTMGIGYCTEKAEYKLGSQNAAPRECVGCKCIEQKAFTRTGAGKLKPIRTGDSEMREAKISIYHRHTEFEAGNQEATNVEPDQTNLRVRMAEPGFFKQLEAGTRVPFGAQNQKLPFAHLGQSSKYVVHCPENIVLGCRDGGEVAKGMGYCTDKARFKLQSAMVSRKQCKVKSLVYPVLSSLLTSWEGLQVCREKNRSIVKAIARRIN